MIINNCEQRSDEWYILKAGVPSASNFDKIITANGKPSKQRTKYLYQLVGEKMLGKMPETYMSWAMERGVELEDEAITYFSLKEGVEIERIGLCFKDERKDRSCSPDGLINSSIGLEIKCPILTTHVEYLMNNALPTTYFQQVQGSMYITGYETWWFVSYFPGLPLLAILCEREDEFIDKLDNELDMFIEDLDIIREKIKCE